MSRRRIHLFLAAILLGLLLLTLLASKHSLPRRLLLGESTEQAPSSTDKIPTKTERSKHPRKPSIEKTNELLRTTIIEQVTFEDASLLEVAQELNGLLRTKGIYFIIRPTIEDPDFRDKVIKTFKARNLSLRQALDEISKRVGAKWQVNDIGIIITPDPNQQTVRIYQRLNEVIIQNIDFENTSIEEALDFLRQRSRELDPASEPAQKGVSFVIRKSRIDGNNSDDLLDADLPPDPDAPSTHITLQAENITFTEALDRITAQTGLRWTIDEGRITIVPNDNANAPDPPQHGILPPR